MSVAHDGDNIAAELDGMGQAMTLVPNGGAGTPADASATPVSTTFSPMQASISTSGAGSPAPSLSDTVAAQQSSAPALDHLGGGGVQLPDFGASVTFTSISAAPVQLLSPAPVVLTISTDDGAHGLVTPAVGSVFSADAGQDSTLVAANFGHSDLPFLSADSAGDPVVYAAASDSDWILVADFASDGWFFV